MNRIKKIQNVLIAAWIATMVLGLIWVFLSGDFFPLAAAIVAWIFIRYAFIAWVAKQKLEPEPETPVSAAPDPQ